MNTLKFYIRLDSSGRAVSGTGVWRKRKPVTGRWTEVNGNTCCGPVVSLSATPTAPGMLNVTLTILCDAVATSVSTLLSSSVSSLDEMVDLLNEQLDWLGKFSTDGSTITLELFLDVAQAMCPDTADLTITITGTTTTTTVP